MKTISWMDDMRRNKPIIGIAAQYDEKEHRLFLVENYEQAVFLAGGIPVILPLHGRREDFLGLMYRCDGFLLPGGPDVSPFLFGEETHEGCGRILPERDNTECMLVREILTNRLHCKKPLLGICRGIQVMNIAMGGSIYQDIAEWRETIPVREKLAHWQAAHASVPTHTVCLDEWLSEQLGGVQELKTNSFHHQVLKKVAPGFSVCGTAKDGVIEAIHKEGHPFCLGIQWHAEDMQKEREQRRLFELLVEKAEIG
ncbi:MAG: gamma-glutamyl-gamma-aminobutyrate hydrolase family protein [Lachnospiraceae bacterium]